VAGHPLKLEAEEGDISSDAPCPSTPVPLNKFRAEMKSFFASSRDNKPSDKLRMQTGSLSGGVSVKKNSVLVNSLHRIKASHFILKYIGILS